MGPTLSWSWSQGPSLTDGGHDKKVSPFEMRESNGEGEGEGSGRGSSSSSSSSKISTYGVKVAAADPLAHLPSRPSHLKAMSPGEWLTRSWACASVRELTGTRSICRTAGSHHVGAEDTASHGERAAAAST